MDIPMNLVQAAEDMPREAEIQVLSFRTGNELFGVPIHEVQEVLLPRKVTPVPLAPDFVMGMISLRGQILTCIDTARRIGIQRPAPEADLHQIVVRTGQGTVSLSADSIGEVLAVKESEMKAPPESLSSMEAQYLFKVVPEGKEMLMLLDLNKVCGAE